MPVTLDQYKALRAQGLSPDQIKTFSDRMDAEAAPQTHQQVAGQVLGQLGSNALEALPYVAGMAAPSLLPELGGAIGPIARILAAGGGGSTGQVAKNVIQGKPFGQGVVAQGAGQAGLQAIPEAVGLAAQGLKGIQSAMRVRGLRQLETDLSAKQALARSLVPEIQSVAKDVAGKSFDAGVAAKSDLRTILAQKAQEAVQAREAAGADVQAALASSEGQVTRKQIVDAVVRKIGPADAQAERVLRRQVMNRLTEVVGKNPVIAARIGNPRKLVFDAPEVNMLKRYWGTATKSGMEQVQGGYLPNPTLDPFIGSALKDVEAVTTPAVVPLNQVSQQALLKARALQTAQQALPHPALEETKVQVGKELALNRADLRAQAAQERLALTQASQMRGAKEAFMRQREMNPLAFYRPLPEMGKVGLVAPVVKTGRVSELGGRVADLALSQPGSFTSFLLPRILAYLSTLEQK